MSNASFEDHFAPGVIQGLDMRLNDVEYACSLLRKAKEARESKVQSLSLQDMSPEQRAAAAANGLYIGGADIVSLCINGFKELKARRFERGAHDILNDNSY